MKVFGIGLPRTGTTTLMHACRDLGFRGSTYNATAFYRNVEAQREELAMQQIFKFIHRNTIFQDLPFPMMFKSLTVKYPDARFILTLRKDPSTWYQSLVNNAEAKKNVLHIRYLRKMVYGHEMPDEKNWKEFIDKYMDHEYWVRKWFELNPELKFIELCWENGDGWEKLCKFLDKPIPDHPFPHKNQSKK